MRAVQKLGMFVVAMALVGTVGPGSSAGPEQEKREHAANGTWGGRGVRLEVHDEGAQAEFDCAHGEITEPLVLDK